jgi:hypothetical protein
MRGPIDYIIVGFKDAKFNGGILKSLGDAVDSGAIALVDLAVISKDKDGSISTVNIADINDNYIVEFVKEYVTVADSVDSDDINEAGELLENGSLAGLLIVEQLWAKPLKQALIEANGELIAEGRIHPDAASELE